MTSILKVDEIQNTDGKTGIVITPDGSLESVKFPEQSSPSGRVITSTTMSSYEEGTWTPVDVSGANLTFDTINFPTYTKIGNLVYLYAYIGYPANTNGVTVQIGGLPFKASPKMHYSQLVLRVTSDAVSSQNLTFQVETGQNKGNIYNGPYPINNSDMTGIACLISGIYQTDE